MSWFGQALHVARKDLLMARWLVLALLALLIAAAAPPSGYVDGALDDWALQLILVGVAILLVAMVVQADSPVRSDAFWVTRPLRPHAVLAAKLFIALAFLALGLIGQSVALHSYDIPARDYLPHLVQSALVTGRWLVLAAVIAALTQDMRMFVLASVSLVVGASVLAMVQISMMSEGSVSLFIMTQAPSQFLLPGVLLLALVALLAHQYITRRRGRTLILSTALAAAWLLGTRVQHLPVPELQHTAAPAEARARVADARVRFPRTQATPRYIDLVLELDGAVPDHRYTMTEAVLQVRLPDGTVDGASVDLVRAAMSPTVIESDATSHMELRVNLTPSLDAALRAEGAVLSFTGHMLVAGKTDMGSLPLSERGTLRLDGRRVRVVRRTDPGADVAVQVASAAVLPPHRAGNAAARITWGRDFEYTLVNAEGDTLRASGGSASGAGAALVLPGPRLIGEVSEMRIERSAGMSTEALRGATLHVGLWQSLGGYLVRAPVTLRQEAVR